MKLLLPKTHIDVVALGLPVFYLAGPIRGADDWQADVAGILDFIHEGQCIIVNPSRYEETHPLYAGRLRGDENHFERQTDWEDFYMRLAATSSRGCLIFWLPAESKQNPRPKAAGAYARDTLGEIGEWRGRLMGNEDELPRHRIVFGAEPDFPGLSQIKRNFEIKLKERPVTFHDSVASTLVAAIQSDSSH